MPIFIGDVHGKFKQYRELIRDKQNTVQVGDMGVGFRYSHGPREGEMRANPPYDAMLEGGHRFIRGNHDNPAECRKHSQFIADGTIEYNMMFIGGAVSIDKEWRVPNYSWWADEELSTDELNRLVDAYKEAKPQIMVTHDCPESLAEAMACIGDNGGKLDPQFTSRSRQAFESMLYHHRPKIWVYGHWHNSFDHVIDGTRFVCLGELEAKELTVV